MKINKGMYIRTKKGIIQKWGEYDVLIKEWEDRFNYNDEDGDLTFVFENEIVKYSNNIIDLIEVGDYVNGDLVLFAGATTWDNDGNVLDKQVHINHNGYDLWLREEYIKSIVTKEQFESTKYEVK